jgi:hypothetical protein
MSTDQAALSVEHLWSTIIGVQPPAVRTHLAAERAFAAPVIGGYNALVEVGCADGSLLLPSAHQLGLDYLGIDLAADAVTATRSAGGAAVRADVVDLATLTLPAGPLLVAYPFNVFGNLPDPHRALAATATATADALVLTYRTDARAAAVRAEYYAACGLPGDLTTDETGVHFASGGFRSSVYHPEVLTAWLSAHGYHVTLTPYGTVGLAYHARLAGQ